VILVFLNMGPLAARRLIEAGAHFVTVAARSGWDTHRDQVRLLRNLLRISERALSALIAVLDGYGLLAGTVVYCIGEPGGRRGSKARQAGTTGRRRWRRSLPAGHTKGMGGCWLG
jgi:hypothetical protein